VRLDPLIDAIESLEAGLLLYDADDRLVLSNRRVLELVPAVADLIKPGVRFEDVVRAAAERGYYRGAGDAIDAVVSERLMRQMLPDGRIEMHLDDAGRVVQVKESRTRDGGRLILVTDVTELRRTTAALQARVERAGTLNQLAQLISSSLDLETVLSEIARAASALLRAPVVRFWMVDEDAQTLWLAADAAEGPVDHGPNKVNIGELRGVLGWVAEHRQPLMIPNAVDDPRVHDAAWWAERGLTSFLGQPVMLDGRLLAVLVLWGREPFSFDADDEALLTRFISQAALSIRNAQLYLDTDQQRRRLQSLVEVSHRLSRGLDLAEVLDAITEAAAIFAGEAGVRLLVGDELVRASVSRGARQRPSGRSPAPPSRSPAPWSPRSGSRMRRRRRWRWSSSRTSRSPPAG